MVPSKIKNLAKKKDITNNKISTIEKRTEVDFDLNRNFLNFIITVNKYTFFKVSLNFTINIS